MSIYQLRLLMPINAEVSGGVNNRILRTKPCIMLGQLRRLGGSLSKVKVRLTTMVAMNNERSLFR